MMISSPKRGGQTEFQRGKGGGGCCGFLLVLVFVCRKLGNLLGFCGNVKRLTVS